MTARIALCLALLEGRVLTVKNCFEITGLTNAGREIPRMVEKPFGLVISRLSKVGKSRYGQIVSYTEYRLNKDAQYNQEGLAKLREFVAPYLKEKKDLKNNNTLFNIMS